MPDRKEPPNNKPIQSELYIVLSFPNSKMNSISITRVQSPNSCLLMTSFLPSSCLHTDLHVVFHRLCSWQLPALSILGTHSSASLQQRDAQSFYWEHHLILQQTNPTVQPESPRCRWLQLLN